MVRVSATVWVMVCAACYGAVPVASRRTEDESRRRAFIQKYTDDILSQVNSFETVIPELVDGAGNFISYDVRHINVNRQILNSQRSNRHKRGVESARGLFLDGADQLGRNTVFYKLRAYGREYHFNLTLNTELLSNNFWVELRGNDGTVQRVKEFWDCHYSGFSMEPSHSNAALSNCLGLYGVFSTDVDDYFVEPLWNHTNNILTEGHPHLVYSRSSLKSSEYYTHCGVSDYQRKKYLWLKHKSPRIFNEVLKPELHLHKWKNNSKVGPAKFKAARFVHRSRRSVSTERHVETLVVIDKKMVDYYQQHDDLRNSHGLTAYALSIMNIGGGFVGCKWSECGTRYSIYRHITRLYITLLMTFVIFSGGKVAKLFHDSSIGNAINIVVTRLIVLSGDEFASTVPVQYSRNTDVGPLTVLPIKEFEKIVEPCGTSCNANKGVCKYTTKSCDLSMHSFLKDLGNHLPLINHHADKSLDSFCRWQQSLNDNRNLSDGHTPHDNAVLITRYDICTYKNEPCGTLGLAPVEGICEKDRSCNINQDIGLASAFIIAHEIGHNFGMHHDGAGNKCGIPGYEPARIMAARLTKDTSPFQWSSCSRNYITDFLDSGRGWCLENIPLKREAFPRDLAGENLDLDTQCRQQFGEASVSCKQKRACRELWCINNLGECVTNSIPAAEGTECYMSRHKIGWCFLGDCRNTKYESQTVHGSWGQWAEWGECSRTCGGGVEASDRDCNDPVPQDGGRYCIGQRKRYRSCNVTPCLPDSIDFRAVQCSSYDNTPFRGRYYKWLPYTGEQAKPCALVCMAEGYNFYTERVSKVIDGTRCYPDKPHICINGECKFVGCDGYLGSRKKEDVCRVCDGDNSTCRTISGFVDKPLPKGGFLDRSFPKEAIIVRIYYTGDSCMNLGCVDKSVPKRAYQEIVTIPRGAVYVQITETALSSNYLALKDAQDHYYINGDWTIDWPRKFPIAGTVFHYKLADHEPESMHALGPTEEDLVVMMLLQEENRGIQYQYNLPVNTSGTHHDVSLYTWRHSSWSPCTKSCSTGNSISVAECVNKSDGSVLENAYCFPQPKPSDHNKHCNQHSCPPKWTVGQWGECSQTCGEGVRTRPVTCMQLMTEGDEVVQDDSECSQDDKPETQQDCNLQRCPAIWHIFEWSECTPSCGPGEMTRRVVCVTSDSDDYLEEWECESSGEAKPATHQACMNRHCPPPQWRKSEWSQCSASCGKGTQERTVQCQTFDGDPCDSALRPLAVRDCHSTCNGQEDAEDCEDKFKVAYCPLVFNFGYCERPYFQTMCCQTCSKNGTPRPLPTFVRRG